MQHCNLEQHSPSAPPHGTAKYNPSTATFACHIPNIRTILSIIGAGKTSTYDTGTATTRGIVKNRVMLGLMTKK
jgi:hypothetical protein